MLIAVPAHSYDKSTKLNYFFFDNESDLVLDIKENLEDNLSEFTTKFKLSNEVKFMWYTSKAPISRHSLNVDGFSTILSSVAESNRKEIVNSSLVITEDSFHFEGIIDGIQYYSDILNLDAINKIILCNKSLHTL